MNITKLFLFFSVFFYFSTWGYSSNPPIGGFVVCVEASYNVKVYNPNTLERRTLNAHLGVPGKGCDAAADKAYEKAVADADKYVSTNGAFKSAGYPSPPWEYTFTRTPVQIVACP